MTPQVVVTCGVGGVGKTTTAAAFGVAHALAGARVVVVTIDPARRLADALGVSLTSHTPERVPLDDPSICGTLSAVMLDRKAMWDSMVRTLAPSADAADRLIHNRYYRAVSTRLTGSHEYMAVELLHALVAEGAWDVIVLDTPPASNAEEFLRAPDRVRRLLDRRVLEALTGSAGGLFGGATRKALGLARRLIGERVFDDIQEFLGLLSAISEQVVAHNAAIDKLLASRSTAFYLVVTVNHGRDADDARFIETLRERGIRFGGFIANRVHEPPPPIQRFDPQPPSGVDPAAWAQWVDVLGALPNAAAREAEHDRRAAERLASGGDSVWCLPEVPGGAHSVTALRRLAERLPPR